MVTFAHAADERGRDGRGLHIRPDNSIQRQRERDAVRCSRAWLAWWALPPRALTRCRSYTVKHWDPPNKVVVTGDSSSVAAEDAIVFSDGATPGTTKIEYTVRRARCPCGATALTLRARWPGGHQAEGLSIVVHVPRRQRHPSSWRSSKGRHGSRVCRRPPPALAAALNVFFATNERTCMHCESCLSSSG